MKRKTTYLLIGLILVVLGGALAIGLSQNGVDAMCAKPGTVTRTITIKDDKVSPADISGKLCDTLTFVNQDDEIRGIAFGPHENHVPYDGVAERFLGRGQSFTITFDQVGMFHWHDHLHDEVQGYFTVAK